jgi:hypothetical protein
MRGSEAEGVDPDTSKAPILMESTPIEEARRLSLAPRPSSPILHPRLDVLLSLLLLALGMFPALGAQGAQAATPPGQDPGAWNSPRVLGLVEEARRARQTVRNDAGLDSYQALTEGHIYFYVDPEEGERALIRIDQVAVELFWEAPDQVRQRIVGERSETRLPVRDFRYYLDRLTLVQYGFGDEIQVGHGMDVADVPHPLAALPGVDPSLEPYDFRLADSLTLTLPGAPEALRVYELEVRPRDPSQPGIVGTFHLSRSDGQLVRMAFTFTPASYVDRRNDRVSVELDYGLWEGRFWLPNRQVLEVRREIPELDLGVGTVIRAVLRVGGYRFDEPIPPDLRFGPPITTLPASERETFPFREGLFDGMERDGVATVATRVDPRELQARAARLLRDQPPTGLSPLRIHLPSVSSFLAYDRTRGLDLGAGASFRPNGTLQLRGSGGWAFAAARPRAELSLEGITSGPWVVSVRGRWNGRGDLGVDPAIAPFLGSAGALILGEDYRDPWRISGGAFEMERQLPDGGRVRLGLGVEHHASHALEVTTAPLGGDRAFRPVLPVDEGFLARGSVGWWGLAHRLPLGARGEMRGRGEALVGESGLSVRLDGETRMAWSPPRGERELQVEVTAGTRLGEPLLQHRRLLGGRGTIPGFPFRGFAGDHHVQGSIIGALDLGSPLVRARVGGHGGWIGGGDPEPWGLPGSRNVRVGVTAGVGLLYDLLRLEGARGLSGGEWQFLISLDPRWWDWL